MSHKQIEGEIFKETNRLIYWLFMYTNLFENIDNQF